MEEIIFHVKGSSSNIYKVTFTRNHNNINAFCTCPAGKKGQYCKHRFAIMSGDSKQVLSSNLDQVSIVESWLPGSDLEEALIVYATALHNFDKAKAQLSEAKKNIARAMRY